MATIGGNLCNASPAADSAVALVALNAKAAIAGPQVKKIVELEDFFVGPGKTILQEDELLTGVFIEYLQKGSGSAFMKISRTSFDIATVNTAAVVQVDGNIVRECKVVIGAVAPTPLRLKRVEEFIIGKKVTSEVFIEAASRGCRDIRPITDVRAKAEYRRAVSKVLIRDTLATACSRAKVM
jgi:carbon-monoxide dehydrogenase medium subunit